MKWIWMLLVLVTYIYSQTPVGYWNCDTEDTKLIGTGPMGDMKIGTQDSTAWPNGVYGKSFQMFKKSRLETNKYEFEKGITISFWFKGMADGMVVATEQYQPNNNEWLTYTNSKLQIKNLYSQVFSLPAKRWEWVFVTLTMKSGVSHLYVDNAGVLITTSGRTVRETRFVFGEVYIADYVSSFLGFLDDIKVFDKYLSSSEALALYEDSKPPVAVRVRPVQRTQHIYRNTFFDISGRLIEQHRSWRVGVEPLKNTIITNWSR